MAIVQSRTLESRTQLSYTLLYRYGPGLLKEWFTLCKEKTTFVTIFEWFLTFCSMAEFLLKEWFTLCKEKTTFITIFEWFLTYRAEFLLKGWCTLCKEKTTFATILILHDNTYSLGGTTVTLLIELLPPVPEDEGSRPTQAEIHFI